MEESIQMIKEAVENYFETDDLNYDPLDENDSLRIGNSDFDFDSGGISCRVSLFCGVEEFLPLTYKQIDSAVLFSIYTIKNKKSLDVNRVYFIFSRFAF